MTNSELLLKEAKRLYKLGFAILWIKPRSKAPVNSKWTTGPRDSWELLGANYKPGYNMGVRLGTPSVVEGKYLAVIDIDVKSTDPKHRAQAEKAVKELFPSLHENNPCKVLSGRGNGSSHLYVVTSTPARPLKLKVSADKVRVLMPSAPINPAQRELLSEHDLNEGWRLRPAWEVAVMGEGQQVVLPPSTHPDTGCLYSWENQEMLLSGGHCLQEMDFGGNKKDSNIDRTATQDWKPELVDLAFSGDLHASVLDDILYANVEDRSATLFKVAIAMVKEGWTDRQIMSVLTDPSYELGKVAYEHAKTNSRARAANWIFNYTLKKAREEADARYRFDQEVETVLLEPEAAKAQLEDLVLPIPWQEQIERNGPKGVNAGCPKATLKNLILILTNEVAVDIFKRDEFSIRDFYGHDAPWGGKKDRALTDDDPLKIKVWLSNRYLFEPKKELLWEALTYLAEKNAFDPVREWLEALPEWDGSNRLDYWLADHFEAEGDPEYLAQVFRKWMVAMVMRVYRPGAKFDWMPIFEGKQGIGKSSIGRLLVGDKYFLDWLPDLADKDSALSLQGAWNVEFGELANLRKQDVESAKAFVTRTVDKVRPPYGRKWIESPRRCVFFGTTNSDAYLRDDSGNRRFKPIKVGQLNFEALERDREQLFAEALFIYRNELEDEKSLEIEGEAKIYEAQIQKDKMVEDDSEVMREMLLDFIKQGPEIHEKAGIEWGKFKLQTLFENFGPLSKKRGDTRDRMFAAKALKTLGAKSWKSSGVKVWSLTLLPNNKANALKEANRDTSGTPRSEGVPVKNPSVFNH